jgi:hypothetical protein
MSTDTLWSELLALAQAPPVGEWYGAVEALAVRMNKRRATYALCELLCSTHACPSRLLSVFRQISLYENIELYGVDVGEDDDDFAIPLLSFINTSDPTVARARVAVLRQRQPENIELTYRLSLYIVRTALQTGIVDFVRFFLDFGLHTTVLRDVFLKSDDALRPYLFRRQESTATLSELSSLWARRLSAPGFGASHYFSRQMEYADRLYVRHEGVSDAWIVQTVRFLLHVIHITPFVNGALFTRGRPISAFCQLLDMLALAAGFRLQYDISAHEVDFETRLFSDHIVMKVVSPLVAACLLKDRAVLVRNALAMPHRRAVLWYQLNCLSVQRSAWARSILHQTFSLPIDRVFSKLAFPVRFCVCKAVRLRVWLQSTSLPRLPYEIWMLIWQCLL